MRISGITSTSVAGKAVSAVFQLPQKIKNCGSSLLTEKNFSKSNFAAEDFFAQKYKTAQKVFSRLKKQSVNLRDLSDKNFYGGFIDAKTHKQYSGIVYSEEKLANGITKVEFRRFKDGGLKTIEDFKSRIKFYFDTLTKKLKTVDAFNAKSGNRFEFDIDSGRSKYLSYTKGKDGKNTLITAIWAPKYGRSGHVIREIVPNDKVNTDEVFYKFSPYDVFSEF